jgi:glutathione-regulated potassium-efflux system ancillary protein KefC
VARARDVTHWNQLRDRGVMLVQREMFESSLMSARSVLELLGQSQEAADQTTRIFRQHNLELFEQLHPHYQDRAKLISVVKQGRAQLEQQMAQEREAQRGGTPAGGGGGGG